MKKLLVVLIMLTVTISAFSQGKFISKKMPTFHFIHPLRLKIFLEKVMKLLPY